MALLQRSMAHLELARQERQFMNDEIEQTKEQYADYLPTLHTGQYTYPHAEHLPFDFAQQVHLPHSPDQEGPLYFKTGFKCCLFGVMSDTTAKQINYIVPESVQTGKGVNEVISMLHHYLAVLVCMDLVQTHSIYMQTIAAHKIKTIL